MTGDMAELTVAEDGLIFMLSDESLAMMSDAELVSSRSRLSLVDSGAATDACPLRHAELNEVTDGGGRTLRAATGQTAKC